MKFIYTSSEWRCKAFSKRLRVLAGWPLKEVNLYMHVDYDNSRALFHRSIKTLWTQEQTHVQMRYAHRTQDAKYRLGTEECYTRERLLKRYIPCTEPSTSVLANQTYSRAFVTAQATSIEEALSFRQHVTYIGLTIVRFV